MASSFKSEVRSIQLVLKGSGWATDPEVNTVLQEYEHLIGAGRVQSTERRTSLQIFFSSRAIDSLLKYVVSEDARHNGRNPPSPSIGNYITYIDNNGLNGQSFPPLLIQDLKDHVRDKRNSYLHEAGIFPSETELKRFLSVTLDGINEIAKIPKPI
jgi:hypothetical protein